MLRFCWKFCFTLVLFFNAEVNLFWAAHQVHHSSEDYTLSTALRQSALQRLTSWVCAMYRCIELVWVHIMTHVVSTTIAKY